MARTDVVIVGAGPAGLTLGLLLQRHRIDSVILEARERAYVEQRVRAGVLEHNTVELLRGLGAGARLAREGLEHHGIYLRSGGENRYVAMIELTGRAITVYGQQEVVKDLIALRLSGAAPLHFEVADVAVHGIEGERPRVSYARDGQREELECDFVAGCDGFHGACRSAVPNGVLSELSFTYPFAWLGILAEARPATDELIYAWHEHGFALYSMRSAHVSRLYLQVPVDEQLEAWPPERLWSELELRLGEVNRGHIFDCAITPMRSVVTTPMQYGRLFLCGDAAHIVPPTGAKGLNLAVNDAFLLSRALGSHYATGSSELLDGYSAAALRRVWRAQHFSWWMTSMLHRFDDATEFDRRRQLAELDLVTSSIPAATMLAQNYVGMPLG